MKKLLLVLPLAACAGEPAPHVPAPSPSPYLFVMSGDHGESPTDADFLSVIDADPASPTWARVVATAPIGTSAGMPHHTEFTMPAGRTLFANAFLAGKVMLLDLTDPRAPRVARTVDSVPGYRRPHSFWRLPDGRVVATLQFGDGTREGDPGGLALFSPEGDLLQASSAADSSFPGARLRVYAIDGSVESDRIVTTSSPMDTEVTAHVIQVWRLSDLSLLRTIVMPESAADSAWQYPFEIRFLPGGRTAMLNTWNCGFYLVTDVAGDSPAVERTMALDPGVTGCGVPLIFGHHWIMPVWQAGRFDVIDIADPRAPRIVSSLAVDSGFSPHWIARDGATDRVVLTSEEPDHRVLLARFDSVRGVLSVDSTFRDSGSTRPGIDFAREQWPHGASGMAMPHAAVFGGK
ncbi:MAG TPA: hypothetical protein VF037_06640 [Gemmatimonadales bacterium]